MSHKPKAQSNWVMWCFLIFIAFVVGRCSTTPPNPSSEPLAFSSSSETFSANPSTPVHKLKKKKKSKHSESSSSSEIDAPDITPLAVPEPTSEKLSNDRYYTNSNGNIVHAPTRVETGCASVGATAQCRDGTCSFSQSHRGTCSRHGGVSRWLD